MKLRITIIDSRGKTKQKYFPLSGSKSENDYVVRKLDKSFRKLQLKGSIMGYKVELVP